MALWMCPELRRVARNKSGEGGERGPLSPQISDSCTVIFLGSEGEFRMAKLTPKQKLFVAEYLVDLNATQAAIRAGYSEKRASEIGYQLLQKTTVQAEVQEAMADREERTGVTQDRVVAELERVAFAEAHDYTDTDLKYANKLKALELLGRHLGMFTDKVEQTGETTLRLELGAGLEEMAK